MAKNIKGFIRRVFLPFLSLGKIEDALFEIRKYSIWASRNDAKLENERRLQDPIHLDRYGYKVYSQNDEDGIIHEIFERIGTTNKTFVEFGVENGLECNTHFLLLQGWNGLWIEGSVRNYKEINEHFQRPLAKKRLVAVNSFITAENINQLIQDNGISGDIDLLSIDIDGNDYWVWKAIDCVQPRVVAIEFNAKFPPPVEWVMPYDPEYAWDFNFSDKQVLSDTL
jgi:hypothetical protein